jgi:hypothetical protein
MEVMLSPREVDKELRAILVVDCLLAKVTMVLEMSGIVD